MQIKIYTKIFTDILITVINNLREERNAEESPAE